MHRLDWSILSSKEFWGNGVRTYVNSKGKIPSTGKKISPEEDRTHDAVSSMTASPTHYQLATPVPRCPPRLRVIQWSMLLLFVGCLMSQQHASVSQGRICKDNFTCCHAEREAADQTFFLMHSQHTDTGSTSPSTDPMTLGSGRAVGPNTVQHSAVPFPPGLKSVPVPLVIVVRRPPRQCRGPGSP